MNDEKRFLVDVGMKDLPFPIRVLSRVNPEGQFTIANISVDARIMQQFEAKWIDQFIIILHQHRDIIGTKTIATNVWDYLEKLKANTAQITFDYPFFVEKLTPVSKEKCLVRYLCKYIAKAHSTEKKARVIFRIAVPCITTYPASHPEMQKSLFGQLSIIDIEVDSKKDVYPESIIDLVDKHALVPVYSFLTEKDQDFVIDKIHSQSKTSVVVIDEIKDELARDSNINWYAVRSSNFGMLHSYQTVIGTEKSMWVPFSGYSEDV
ncbi:MAG: GTP cyclohydrolase, FolE2/MptA family [Sedimentisphaerales bacterium]